MGEEENFTVDPMNGRIILQERGNKRIEVLLEKVEEKWERERGEERESEIDMISNFNFPNFDKELETEEERFKRRMKDFSREMERKKEEWKEKVKGMEKKWIKWEWTANNGIKFNGMYAGEVKDEKPHGLGKWKRDGSHWTVEGEWKDGLLDGKAVENNIFGHDEYEAKDGKKNGKFMRYFVDGCRE